MVAIVKVGLWIDADEPDIHHVPEKLSAIGRRTVSLDVCEITRISISFSKSLLCIKYPLFWALVDDFQIHVLVSYPLFFFWSLSRFSGPVKRELSDAFRHRCGRQCCAAKISGLAHKPETVATLC